MALEHLLCANKRLQALVVAVPVRCGKEGASAGRKYPVSWKEKWGQRRTRAVLSLWWPCKVSWNRGPVAREFCRVRAPEFAFAVATLSTLFHSATHANTNTMRAQVSFMVSEDRVLSVVARDLDTNRQYQWLENGRMMVKTLSGSVGEVHTNANDQHYTVYPAANAGMMAA